MELQSRPSRAGLPTRFVVLAALGVAAGSSAVPARGDVEEARDAPSLLATYCYDCHGFGAKKGGLALDSLLAAGEDAGRSEWMSVWKLLRHEFMPPAEADQPDDEERRELTRWIERAIFHVDSEKPDPGRVTVRRLNRMEYQYTIHDLFGIGVDLAKELPPDDTAFGFDNIGDALTLSPALLETYLDLAETIVSNVIALDGPRHPRMVRHPPDFRVDGPDDQGRVEHAALVTLPHSGVHRVEVQFRLGGFRATTGDYRFEMEFAGTRLAEETVSDGGEKTYVFTGELELPSGEHSLVLVTRPDSDEPGALRLSPRATVVGPLGTGIYEEPPESHRRVFFQGAAPDDPAARREYARAVIRRIADRAFRRPAEEAMVDRLTNLALEEDGETFEAGVARAITAILSSPRFFFRAESQPNPDEPDEIHPLDDFALASRLSYLLWLSLPDEELTESAAKGTLRDDLPGQLRRMLADRRSGRFFEDFAGQWLRTRNILLSPLNLSDLPQIDPLRGPMKRETEMLFEHVAREDRDLIELLTADYSFLNQRLAEHYGVEGVEGDRMQRVTLPKDSRRGGILTHGSLLISTSNPGRTSPVKRGVFVLENLLAREVPPPPPDVGELEGNRRGRTPRTLREQLAAHRDQVSCASCHKQFDPIGLAMENYDHLGRWRDRERGGQPVDATATLVTGEEIDGAAELSVALASRPEAFYRCVAEKLLTYALGRGLEPSDAATIDDLTARTSAGGGTFTTLLTAVVQSPPFQFRRGDSGDSPSRGPAVRLEPPPPERRGAAARSMLEAARRAARKNQEAEAGGSSSRAPAISGDDQP